MSSLEEFVLLKHLFHILGYLFHRLEIVVKAHGCLHVNWKLMVSEGSNHCHEGSRVFPEADQSYYSTYNNPDLIAVFFDVNFFLFATFLLKFPDKLEALVFADEVGVDSKRDIFLSKLHLHNLSLFGLV